MRFRICAAAALVSGCAASVAEKTDLVTLTPAMREEVAAGIKKQLKDPASAQFGPMSAARSVKTGLINVCGTVNAKNSFGGYTGAVRFIASIGDGGGNPRGTEDIVRQF
jgi:dUTPase